MSNLLSFIEVVLIVAWAIGYFGFATGSIIHLLLIVALVIIMVRAIWCRITV